MSWAVARTWPSGGRRTTHFEVPSVTAYVRFDHQSGPLAVEQAAQAVEIETWRVV
jgi:hypothetical protein